MTPPEHSVGADVCKERHDRLKEVLFAETEGIVPRVRKLETAQAVLNAKLAAWSGLGAIIGSAVMTFVMKKFGG